MLNSEIKRNLAKLPTSLLVEFISELHGADKLIDKKIDRLLLQSDKPKFIKKLTSTIKGLKRRRKFVDYWESSEFAQELKHLLSDVMTLQEDQPRQCLELLELFIASSESSLNRCDDLNGEVGGVYRSLAQHWLSVAHTCYELDKAQASIEEQALLSRAWQNKVIELAKNNDFGEMDELLSNVGRLLSTEEVMTLIEHYQMLYNRTLKSKNQDDDDYEVMEIAINLENVTKALGDVELYESIYLQVNKKKAYNAKKTTLNTLQLEEMIRYFYSQFAYDKAIHYLNKVWISDDNYDEIRRLDWLITLYEATGDSENKLAVMTEAFEKDPTPQRLKAILAMVPAEQKPIWREKALSLAQQQQNILKKLRLLLDLDELSLADAAAINAKAQLATCQYNGLTDLLKQTPLQAYFTQVIIYRSLLNDILNNARSKAYGHAARYYRQLYNLDAAIYQHGKSYEGIITHQEYLTALKDKHGKKTTFWALIDY